MVDQTQGGFLMSQIKRIGDRVFNRLLDEAGIEEFNGAQGKILYVLWQQDSVPIVTLARKTGLAKTTLTSMLDRMEQQELVTRVYDKADRRVIRIVLTQKAKALSGEYRRVSAHINELYYRGFSDDEIRSFEAMLERILDNLTEQESVSV